MNENTTYHVKFGRPLVVIEQPTKYGPQYIEVSASINADTGKLEREYRDNTQIKWSYRLMMHIYDPLANWQPLERAEERFGAEVIGEAKERAKIEYARIMAQVNAARNHPAYNRMAEIAQSTIKYYPGDFTFHDCLSLGENFERPFLWIVRDTGTRFLAHNDSWADEVLRYDTKNNPDSLCYFYNGQYLESVALSNATSYFDKLSQP